MELNLVVGMLGDKKLSRFDGFWRTKVRYLEHLSRQDMLGNKEVSKMLHKFIVSYSEHGSIDSVVVPQPIYDRLVIDPFEGISVLSENKFLNPQF